MNNSTVSRHQTNLAQQTQLAHKHTQHFNSHFQGLPGLASLHFNTRHPVWLDVPREELSALDEWCGEWLGTE